MAITAAQLQTALDASTPVTGNDPQVMQHLPPYTGTQQHWLIRGGVTYPGRTKFVDTTAADDAATQAAAVVTSLRAGPA